MDINEIKAIQPIIPKIDHAFLRMLAGKKNGKKMVKEKAESDFQYLNAGNMAKLNFEHDSTKEEYEYHQKLQRNLGKKIIQTDLTIPMSMVNGNNKKSRTEFKDWSFDYKLTLILSGSGAIGLLIMGMLGTHMAAINSGSPAIIENPEMAWLPTMLIPSAALAFKFIYKMMPTDLWRKLYKAFVSFGALFFTVYWVFLFGEANHGGSEINLFDTDNLDSNADQHVLTIQILADLFLGTILFLVFSDCFIRHSTEWYTDNPQMKKLKSIRSEEADLESIHKKLSLLIQKIEEMAAAYNKHEKEVLGEFDSLTPNK